MAKLIVTADVHGSLASWLTLKSLLGPGDALIIAGDLFDTRYGNFSNSDFKPDQIKADLARFSNGFYYVYGNCDVPSFFPGFEFSLEIHLLNHHIFMVHGHGHCRLPNNKIDIVITGHTHRYHLQWDDGSVFMNPGSITYPKTGISTYGVIDDDKASIIDLETGNTLLSETLSPNR